MNNDSNNYFLGIDTGGTFTDFVLAEGENIRIHKVLSTPSAPEKAILQGIAELGISLDGLKIVHGSTVATNAVLEGKGAKTAYITNKGFKDVLHIGRQTRKKLYDLTPIKTKHIVDNDLCFEIDVRITADGEILNDLQQEDLQSLLTEIQNHDIQSVAINFLYSFLDERHEQQVAQELPKSLFISCSHEVLAEAKEYERGITTWLNAYVGPLVNGYLNNLQQQTEPAAISVMRSSGQTTSAATAGEEAVHLLLSGPAGGLNAAKFISQLTSQNKLLTFDMGGTSTDVAMFDGEIALGQTGWIVSLPVSVPMIDIHTIGAGGGSIAWVDAGGALHVGPESAGANPGPACYNQGGTQATVTDANLVLGHLPKSVKLGGSMTLQLRKAEEAMSDLQQQADLESIEKTAEGILRIANEKMAEALRVISIERGIDPAEFALLAFGGAGGLHICALADSLNMTRAIVPIHSGVLSALGMLAANPGREVSRTIAKPLQEVSDSDIEHEIHLLKQKAETAIGEEGITKESLTYKPSLDICFRGQSSSLNVPWQNRQQVISDFEHEYKNRYGQLLDSALELVTVRLSVNAHMQGIAMSKTEVNTHLPQEFSEVYSIEQTVEIIPRAGLAPGEKRLGPVIITDAVATVWIEPSWQAELDEYGNLLLIKLAK